jgi:hypothetical protein
VLLLGLVAGCGSSTSSTKPTDTSGETATSEEELSSSSSSSSSSSASSAGAPDAAKAEAYTASAGALCRRARRAASGDALSGSNAKMARERLEGVVTELRTAKPSEQDTAAHDRLVAAVSRMQTAALQSEAGRDTRAELKRAQQELQRAARSLSLRCS